VLRYVKQGSVVTYLRLMAVLVHKYYQHFTVTEFCTSFWKDWNHWPKSKNKSKIPPHIFKSSEAIPSQYKSTLYLSLPIIGRVLALITARTSRIMHKLRMPR